MLNSRPFPPPFRAEHIGSLKRPKAILEAREAVEEGKLSKEELKKVEDKEILRIIKLQRDLGYKSITDGEYRRHMFYDGFFDNLEGMTYYTAHPDPSIFKDCISRPRDCVNCRCPGYCRIQGPGIQRW